MIEVIIISSLWLEQCAREIINNSSMMKKKRKQKKDDWNLKMDHNYLRKDFYWYWDSLFKGVMSKSFLHYLVHINFFLEFHIS